MLYNANFKHPIICYIEKVLNHFAAVDNAKIKRPAVKQIMREVYDWRSTQ